MQPDLFIACDLEEKLNEKDRYMGTPALVVEILSPSTRSRDMVDKLNTYMISGVREFWVVDPEQKTLLVYGFKGSGIDFHTTYRVDEVCQSYCFEGLEAPLREVFSS